MYGRHEVRFASGEVDVQPASDFRKDWYLFFFVFRIKAERVKFFTFKPQAGQAIFIGGKENVAERGLAGSDVLHCHAPKNWLEPSGVARRTLIP